MNIAFNFKNFEPSPGLREYASKRFDKLAKYMPNSDNAEIVVTLLVEKTRQIADVIIDADAMHISAHERSDDMYSTIDMITDKLEAQVRKMREKMKDRRKASSSAVTMGVISFTDEGKVHSIEESDKYNPKPMGVEESRRAADGHEVRVSRIPQFRDRPHQRYLQTQKRRLWSHRPWSDTLMRLGEYLRKDFVLDDPQGVRQAGGLGRTGLSRGRGFSGFEPGKSPAGPPGPGRPRHHRYRRRSGHSARQDGIAQGDCHRGRTEQGRGGLRIPRPQALPDFFFLVLAPETCGGHAFCAFWLRYPGFFRTKVFRGSFLEAQDRESLWRVLDQPTA